MSELPFIILSVIGALVSMIIGLFQLSASKTVNKPIERRFSSLTFWALVTIIAIVISYLAMPVLSRTDQFFFIFGILFAILAFAQDILEKYSDLKKTEEANLQDLTSKIKNYYEQEVEADFSGADLGKVDLQGVQLQNVNLSKANLRKANLRQANLIGANLSYADLREAQLEGANLRQADIEGANLSGANLTGAILSESILINTILVGAILLGADLRNANLFQANLSNALITSEQLKQAKSLGGSVMPDGTNT